jgi:hypothetical protein
MLKEPSRGWQTRQRMRLKVSKRSSRGSRTARQQFFVSTEELSTEERNYICVIKKFAWRVASSFEIRNFLCSRGRNES